VDYAERVIPNKVASSNAVGRVLGGIYFDNKNLGATMFNKRKFVPECELVVGDFNYNHITKERVIQKEQIPISYIRFDTTIKNTPFIDTISYYNSI